MPASSLKLTALGQQTTFGTAVAPTQKFMGVEDATMNIIDAPEIPLVLGNLGPGPLSAQVAQSADASVSGTATYEMLRYLFNGLFTATTAATSSGQIYPYSYTAPVTSTQAHKIYTLEHGTTGQSYKLTGAVLSKLNVSASAGSLWRFAADFIGKQLSTSTGPVSLSDTDANVIRMADTTLSVDVSTGTMGATAVSATLIGFDFNYETGRHTKQFNALTPGDYGEGKHNAMLKLTLEYNASAAAYVEELIGSTPSVTRRQIRLNATQGSSATQKTARIDFAGILQGPPLFADRDGNMTVETNWLGWYSTAYTNFVGAYVQCGSSATP